AQLEDSQSENSPSGDVQSEGLQPSVGAAEVLTQASERPANPSLSAQSDQPQTANESSLDPEGGAATTRSPLWWLLVPLALAGLLTWIRRTAAKSGASESRVTRSTLRLPHGRGTVGDYDVLDVLGRGGMATTYLARRRTDGQRIALKIPHESGDPTYAERFVREGHLGESLHHPGIVRIYGAGEDHGMPFLAMELIEGRNLRQILDDHPDGLEVVRAITIARDICEALDYAHAKGVVHRDLKPENVMIAEDGSVKVMDFGVARVEGQTSLTSSGHFLGSPVYAAPEMINPREGGPSSDLYSLGIMLFEMTEGKPPFVHESLFELLSLHQNQELPPPDSLERPLPPELWSLIRALCQKRPADRCASAQHVLIQLNQLLHRERPPNSA
ncbi:MAG: serine/threonine protein kinase, partial [Thermoanaerobaculia bacterium]|nr:serine/threonine protein kinase [Thermoanaerobaculia bacterium]